MHDSAMEIGKAFFSNYFLGRPAGRILDVGGLDVNGSLRSVAPKHWEYMSVDMTAGKGVDLVLADPYQYPFEDESFDAIVSTSCFEHDSLFWLSFLEMLRVARDGGYIYLNAPSNGAYHRYPVDCWRFYPDAGGALVQWARRSGVSVHLCESFVGSRDRYGWSDFAAVFRKGETHSEVTPLHATIKSANILVDEEQQPKLFIAPTEDGRELQQLRTRLGLDPDTPTLDGNNQGIVPAKKYGSGASRKKAFSADGDRITELLMRQAWPDIEARTADGWKDIAECFAATVEAIARAARRPEVIAEIADAIEAFEGRLLIGGATANPHADEQKGRTLARAFQSDFSDGAAVHLDVRDRGGLTLEEADEMRRFGPFGAVLSLSGKPGNGVMIAAELTTFPFGDAMIDRIEWRKGWEIEARPDLAIRESRRVLRPGGAVRIHSRFLAPDRGSGRDRIRVTASHLEDLLRKEGFDEVECVAPSGPFRALQRLAQDFGPRSSIDAGRVAEAKLAQSYARAVLGAFVGLDDLYDGEGFYREMTVYARAPGRYVPREDGVRLAQITGPEAYRPIMPILRCPETGDSLDLAGDRLVGRASGRAAYPVDGVTIRFDRAASASKPKKARKKPDGRATEGLTVPS